MNSPEPYKTQTSTQDKTTQERANVFTIARIAASAILFWGVASHSYNYYVLLRFIVLGVGLYGASRTAKEGKWILAGCFAAMAILFNPFMPIVLSKHTWTIVDIGAACFLLVSIMIIDEPQFLRGRATGLLPPVFPILGGLILLGLAVLLLIEGYNSLSDAIYLARNKQTTQGQIVNVYEGEDDDGDRPFTVFGTQYSFKTFSGEIYEGSAVLYDNPLEEKDSTKLLPGVTQDGVTYTPSKTNPILITVEYNSVDPTQNRLTEESKTSLRVIIWETLMGGAGIVFLSLLGLQKIRDGMSEFRKGMKPAIE